MKATLPSSALVIHLCHFIFGSTDNGTKYYQDKVNLWFALSLDINI